jgi:hypothetical protein
MKNELGAQWRAIISIELNERSASKLQGLLSPLHPASSSPPALHCKPATPALLALKAYPLSTMWAAAVVGPARLLLPPLTTRHTHEGADCNACTCHAECASRHKLKEQMSPEAVQEWAVLEREAQQQGGTEDDGGGELDTPTYKFDEGDRVKYVRSGYTARITSRRDVHGDPEYELEGKVDIWVREGSLVRDEGVEIGDAEDNNEGGEGKDAAAERSTAAPEAPAAPEPPPSQQQGQQLYRWTNQPPPQQPQKQQQHHQQEHEAPPYATIRRS